jgi:hypothetical protein
MDVFQLDLPGQFGNISFSGPGKLALMLEIHVYLNLTLHTKSFGLSANECGHRQSIFRAVRLGFVWSYLKSRLKNHNFCLT